MEGEGITAHSLPTLSRADFRPWPNSGFSKRETVTTF